MARTVTERPMLPAGENVRILVKALYQIFTESGTRLNVVIPKDGSELTDMQSFSYVTPAQITANQNDYDLGEPKTIARLSTDASRNITGITDGASNEAGEGRVLVIINVGSFNIVLTHQDAASAAANRFAINANLTLLPDQAVKLWYDINDLRWRLAR